MAWLDFIIFHLHYLGNCWQGTCKRLFKEGKRQRQNRFSGSQLSALHMTPNKDACDRANQTCDPCKNFAVPRVKKNQMSNLKDAK
jgi:hypothetical protein